MKAARKDEAGSFTQGWKPSEDWMGLYISGEYEMQAAAWLMQGSVTTDGEKPCCLTKERYDVAESWREIYAAHMHKNTE